MEYRNGKSHHVHMWHMTYVHKRGSDLPLLYRVFDALQPGLYNLTLLTLLIALRMRLSAFVYWETDDQSHL